VQYLPQTVCVNKKGIMIVWMIFALSCYDHFHCQQSTLFSSTCFTERQTSNGNFTTQV